MQELLKLIEVIAWPVVALTAIFVVHPHLAKLMSGAKVKLSIAGQSIETSLPELKEILESQAGERLTEENKTYLRNLLESGPKEYPQGVTTKDERQALRPLRNNGLVQTIPRNAFLNDARAIELSALGRLYLRASAAR